LKTFEQIHEEGSKKFGTLWLKTNMIIADTGTFYGLEVSNAKIKLALSSIALALLNRIVIPQVLAVGSGLRNDVATSVLYIEQMLKEARIDPNLVQSVHNYGEKRIAETEKSLDKWRALVALPRETEDATKSD